MTLYPLLLSETDRKWTCWSSCCSHITDATTASPSVRRQIGRMLQHQARVYESNIYPWACVTEHQSILFLIHFICQAWDKWRSQITKLDCHPYWLQCDHQQTRIGLKNMIQIMLGNATVLSNATYHWMELYITHLLYIRPFTVVGWMWFL